MTRLLAQPTSPVLAGGVTAPTSHRTFGDAQATRKLIFDNALQAASTLKPLTNVRHTLRLADVHYPDDKQPSIKDQKKAILSGETLSRRLRGTWQLYDNATGDLLEEKKQTIAKIPRMTSRGTFIHNGNEYTISNQMRLRSGIFTRVKDNGEIEAHVNILPGKGQPHRYFLDPEKGVFYAKIKQAKIPLIPLIRALGASDAQIRDAWGPELFVSNQKVDNPTSLNKYFERLLSRKDQEESTMDKRALLVQRINSMELDPEVMERTLGKPYRNLSLDSILDATKKLLAVSRKEAEVDDRDHLAYQTFHGPEDLIAERLAKDYGGIRRQLFSRVSWQNSLKSIQPNALNKQVEAALLHSGLGQAIEEINPSDILDKQSRITRLAEGGIPSLDAVPDEARSVQPSHLGFMDPIRTPESAKVGVDIHYSRAALKGNDGKIYIPLMNARTGETELRSPQDLADASIAFPREMDKPGRRVTAMHRGRMRSVKREEVDFVLPHFTDAFSPLANMIPFGSTVKGQRMMMGAKMLTQALPLTNPEAPLVQAGIPGQPGKSYEDLYGRHMGATYSDTGGRVLSADEHQIVIRGLDGKRQEIELYNNFPYNRKTYLHQTAMVEVGDMVKPGQLIARSNYTDDKGVTALGKNARVAYIPFRGKNFEDAIVISESFGERLSSEHMYQNKMEWGDEHRRGKTNYMGLIPGKYDVATMKTLDKDGIVKVGTMVHYDDPLILAAQAVEPGQHKVHRKGSKSFRDASLTWEHHSPGMVTDVMKSKKGTTVLVKAISPMQIGDKLSGRFGDKGVIADIIPDDQMPRSTDGKPFEILLNPLGLISRTNAAQKIEGALGKIAAKRNKPYAIPDFEDIEDITQFAIDELKQNDMKDREDIIDPETDRKIPNIFTGNRFFMKLHHTAESKGKGRGTGGYTAEETPAKGGEAGSKRISLMDTNALLSHGATNVLRDVNLVRGQRNEDFWLRFMQGHTPPEPEIPFVFQKFVNQLKSAGINVISDGTGMHIMAMTNKDVEELTGNREITSGETVQFHKGLATIKGGLFDPKLTGGHHGDRWSYIQLSESMPNPVMEEPIRRLLNLTKKKFRDVLAGKEEIRTGPETMDSGPQAIKQALEKINIPKELLISRMQIKGGSRTARDTAVRKLGYLKSAQRLGIHPRDWMLDRVPVLPPKYRPISIMEGTKLPLVADPNFLYKELVDAEDNLKVMKGEVEDVGNERLSVYDSFKAITGLGDPLHPKLQEKNVGGVLKHIFGSSPKYGTVQRRLLSSTVDLVGRAVIIPNPDLDMDSIGLPEIRAWDLYQNFIIRRLRRRGLPITEAANQVKERTPLARQEMIREMESRPVFINRAPVLHRFGIMAFRPRLVKGDVVQVSPLVVNGFGADFDGDAIQYHIPVSEEARIEALERMLPSRNLLSPADFKTPVHKPTQEYVGGLHAATSKISKRKRTHRFSSQKDAIKAYLRGEITIDTPVIVE